MTDELALAVVRGDEDIGAPLEGLGLSWVSPGEQVSGYELTLPLRPPCAKLCSRIAQSGLPLGLQMR